MIKVVKYGRREVMCPCCESTLSYEPGDARYVDLGHNELKYFIKCPVCNRDVEVVK